METMYRVESRAFGGQWCILDTVGLDTALTMAVFTQLDSDKYVDVRIVNDSTGEEWVPG